MRLRRLPAAADDPRDRVTPDDLNVAPELLGAPLARPMRRLFAIGIDVTILAALSNYGNVWLVAGFGLIALVYLRDPLAGGGERRKWALWALAAGLIGFGVQQAWVTGRLVQHDGHHRHAGVQFDKSREEGDDDASDAAIEAAVRTMVAAARAGGAASAPVLDAASAPVPQAASAAASAPSPTLAQATAELRIAALEAQLAQAREPKPFNLHDRIMSWADDVGLGLGWAIVYFALVPVWWNGQTVGKRLLGLRVVELTGKPMTVMRAFKRYGGYAAGLATGLFGFAQVLWDPNRQAIQDKTAHTVVIDLRRKLPEALPPPSPDEEPR